MGHPQPIEKIIPYNKTSAGISNNKIKQLRSRATNMLYFWISDKNNFKKSLIAW